MVLTELEKSEYDRYLDSFDFTPWLKDKTILLTGSKGIVGTALTKWIMYTNQLFGTNTKIIASTRNKNSRAAYLEDNDNVVYCEFGKEREFCKDITLDYIIHTAAPTSNKVFQSQPVESLHVIVDGTDEILKIAAEHKGCGVIYLSSEESYGTPYNDEPIDENYVGAISSMNVRNCYPLGKKVAELLCKAYCEEYGVDVKIIRPTVILGLFQEYDSVKVEAEILRCVMEKKNLQMKSAGLTKKTVIYSLDAASAVLMVLFKGKTGEAYNATNPDTYTTVKDRAYDAFAWFDPSLTIEFAETDASQSAGYLPQRALLEDVTKISELGWKPLADMKKIYEIDMKRFQAQGK